METEKAILGRRSVRNYEDKPIPEEFIQKILKAGAMAPSAMNRQSCRFIVIENNEKIREISNKIKKKGIAMGYKDHIEKREKVAGDDIFYGATLLVLLVAEKGDWTVVDCTLAAENMMVQAYDLGLGSCFIGFMNLLKDDKETLNDLGVEENQEIYCPLVFGYPKEWPEQKEKSPKIQKRIK